MAQLHETRDAELQASSTSPGPRWRAWLWRGLQLIATIAAFAYVLSLVSVKALFAALVRVPFGIFVSAAFLTIVALLIGAFRWWLLFRAFGAPRPPQFAPLCRYYFVGFFYNTYLPGGVGGDLVRALASRNAWSAEQAATAGIATVFVDRVLGLAGLLGVVSLVSLVHPLPVLGSAVVPGILGLCGVAVCLVALSSARWLAPRVPEWLGRALLRLPTAERWLPLMAAAALSLFTQVLPALSGHLLLSALAPEARLLDSLAIVPVAAAAAFLPITVSGAGVREALFVKLYATVGIPASAALAASLLLWCSQAAVAAVGGLHALWHPLGNER
jgi:uncharacterized membrane protein YbhN (UPF0104 family)